MLVRLVLDAASPQASAALTRGTELVAEAAGDEPLLALAARALEHAGCSPDEIGELAAVRGPGSFTGLRVALATACGFGRALGIPVLGVDSLTAMALQAPAGVDRVVAVIDALRGEWFHREFRRSGRTWQAAGPAERHAAAELDLPAGVPWLATPSPALLELASPRQVLALCPLAPALARALARGELAKELIGPPEPLYLRAPASTLPR